jgi:hypothetical protein
MIGVLHHEVARFRRSKLGVHILRPRGIETMLTLLSTLLKYLRSTLPACVCTFTLIRSSTDSSVLHPGMSGLMLMVRLLLKIMNRKFMADTIMLVIKQNKQVDRHYVPVAGFVSCTCPMSCDSHFPQSRTTRQKRTIQKRVVVFCHPDWKKNVFAENVENMDRRIVIASLSHNHHCTVGEESETSACGKTIQRT